MRHLIKQYLMTNPRRFILWQAITVTMLLLVYWTLIHLIWGYHFSLIMWPTFFVVTVSFFTTKSPVKHKFILLWLHALTFIVMLCLAACLLWLNQNWMIYGIFLILAFVNAFLGRQGGLFKTYPFLNLIGLVLAVFAIPVTLFQVVMVIPAILILAFIMDRLFRCSWLTPWQYQSALKKLIGQCWRFHLTMIDYMLMKKNTTGLSQQIHRWRYSVSQLYDQGSQQISDQLLCQQWQRLCEAMIQCGDLLQQWQAHRVSLLKSHYGTVELFQAFITRIIRPSGLDPVDWQYLEQQFYVNQQKVLQQAQYHPIDYKDLLACCHINRQFLTVVKRIFDTKGVLLNAL